MDSKKDTEHHPVLTNMLRLCQNQSTSAIAFQVYLELSELHILWDLEYHYNEELDMIYMSGRKTKSSSVDIYVPISSKSGITMTELQKMQNTLCSDGLTKFNLAIKEKDSTVVLYSIQQGLVTPETPEKTKQRKASKEQKNSLEWELKKNKESIYMKAINCSESVRSKEGETPDPPEEPNDEDTDQFAGEL